MNIRKRPLFRLVSTQEVTDDVFSAVVWADQAMADLKAGDLVKVMFRVESTPAHDESMWVEVVSPGHGELAGIPIYVPLAHGAPVAFEAHHIFEIFRMKK